MNANLLSANRYGARYTEVEDDLIIDMRATQTPYREIGRLLNRETRSVERRIAFLKHKREMRAIMEILPMGFRDASKLYYQVREDCPYVATAQGYWSGKWFVSVAFTSHDKVLKVDVAMWHPHEWPPLCSRIREAFARKAGGEGGDGNGAA